VRVAFEAVAQDSLKNWFDQWIDRPGAIQLGLADAAATSLPTGETLVSGVLVQGMPTFDTTVPVVAEGEDGERHGRTQDDPCPVGVDHAGAHEGVDHDDDDQESGDGDDRLLAE